MRCACRLRNQRASSVSFPTPDPLLRRRPAESLRGALRPSRFGFRQMHQGPICIGIPRHLTIRSSRPHVVASAACFTLRLHASAAPPRVGLTQALGGSNPYAVHSDRFSRCSGHFHSVAVSSCCACCVQQSCNDSDSSSGALKHRMRCVCRLRKQ